MSTVSVSELKTSCVRVVDRVHKSGRPVTVTKNGKPVVQVIPIRSVKQRKKNFLGYMKGTGRIIGDIESPAADPSDWELLRD